jgi:hypothetical protein
MHITPTLHYIYKDGSLRVNIFVSPSDGIELNPRASPRYCFMVIRIREGIAVTNDDSAEVDILFLEHVQLS